MIALFFLPIGGATQNSCKFLALVLHRVILGTDAARAQGCV